MGKHFWESRDAAARKAREEQLKKNKAHDRKKVEDSPYVRFKKKPKFNWFKKGD